ncbi:MAG: DUF3500 domain-containing protein [Gemmatimonadetes bacterium]|nr:DUF3500 domain-containing protein [Gemmatimonadota bacterium]
MTSAANRFLQGLSPEQRTTASFALDAAERTRWNFIPTESHRREGLQIKAMSPAQRALAHDLLRSALSPGGYLTANAVMELEAVLRDIEGAGARFVRDPEKYFFSVFGTPASRGSWGWRVEGHHLSLHFTIVDGAWVATAPAFLGSNPAEVRQGPRTGLRILAEREDVGRQLVRSLDQAQRAVAIISATAPNEIVTNAKVDITPLTPVGIRADALRPDQRSLLMHLIGVYASLMTGELATARLEALRRAGLDAITFAWAGGTEPRERHYYRIQGPTFLIEFDNSQNDGNHVHSVWRDFDGDFGRDILREHLSSVAH